MKRYIALVAGLLIATMFVSSEVNSSELKIVGSNVNIQGESAGKIVVRNEERIMTLEPTGQNLEDIFDGDLNLYDDMSPEPLIVELPPGTISLDAGTLTLPFDIPSRTKITGSNTELSTTGTDHDEKTIFKFVSDTGGEDPTEIVIRGVTFTRSGYADLVVTETTGWAIDLNGPS